MPPRSMTTAAGRCPRCGRETIEGRTETGFDVVLDAAELDPRGELAITVAGGATVTRHTWADQLATRYAHTIRERPAGSHPRQAVHAIHDCARPSPTPRRTTGRDPTTGGVGATPALGDAPPF